MHGSVSLHDPSLQSEEVLPHTPGMTASSCYKEKIPDELQQQSCLTTQAFSIAVPMNMPELSLPSCLDSELPVGCQLSCSHAPVLSRSQGPRTQRCQLKKPWHFQRSKDSYQPPLEWSFEPFKQMAPAKLETTPT